MNNNSKDGSSWKASGNTTEATSERLKAVPISRDKIIIMRNFEPLKTEDAALTTKMEEVNDEYVFFSPSTSTNIGTSSKSNKFSEKSDIDESSGKYVSVSLIDSNVLRMNRMAMPHLEDISVHKSTIKDTETTSNSEVEVIQQTNQLQADYPDEGGSSTLTPSTALHHTTTLKNQPLRLKATKLVSDVCQTTAKVSIGNTTISVPLIKPLNSTQLLQSNNMNVDSRKQTKPNPLQGQSLQSQLNLSKILNIKRNLNIKGNQPTIVSLSNLQIKPISNAKILQAKVLTKNPVQATLTPCNSIGTLTTTKPKQTLSTNASCTKILQPSCVVMSESQNNQDVLESVDSFDNKSAYVSKKEEPKSLVSAPTEMNNEQHFLSSVAITTKAHHKPHSKAVTSPTTVKKIVTASISPCQPCDQPTSSVYPTVSIIKQSTPITFNKSMAETNPPAAAIITTQATAPKEQRTTISIPRNISLTLTNKSKAEQPTQRATQIVVKNADTDNSKKLKISTSSAVNIMTIYTPQTHLGTSSSTCVESGVKAIMQLPKVPKLKPQKVLPTTISVDSAETDHSSTEQNPATIESTLLDQDNASATASATADNVSAAAAIDGSSDVMGNPEENSTTHNTLIVSQVGKNLQLGSKSEETHNILLKQLLQNSSSSIHTSQSLTSVTSPTECKLNSVAMCNQAISGRKVINVRAPSLGLVSSLEAQLARPVIPPVPTSTSSSTPAEIISTEIKSEGLNQGMKTEARISIESNLKPLHMKLISKETSFVSSPSVDCYKSTDKVQTMGVYSDPNLIPFELPETKISNTLSKTTVKVDYAALNVKCQSKNYNKNFMNKNDIKDGNTNTNDNNEKIISQCHESKNDNSDNSNSNNNDNGKNNDNSNSTKNTSNNNKESDNGNNNCSKNNNNKNNFNSSSNTNKIENNKSCNTNTNNGNNNSSNNKNNGNNNNNSNKTNNNNNSNNNNFNSDNSNSNNVNNNNFNSTHNKTNMSSNTFSDNINNDNGNNNIHINNNNINIDIDKSNKNCINLNKNNSNKSRSNSYKTINIKNEVVFEPSGMPYGAANNHAISQISNSTVENDVNCQKFFGNDTIDVENWQSKTLSGVQKREKGKKIDGGGVTLLKHDKNEDDQIESKGNLLSEQLPTTEDSFKEGNDPLKGKILQGMTLKYDNSDIALVRNPVKRPHGSLSKFKVSEKEVGDIAKKRKRDCQKHRRQISTNNKCTYNFPHFVNVKKRSRKSLKAEENYDDFIDNLMTQLRQMQPLQVLEPLLNRNFSTSQAHCTNILNHIYGNTKENEKARSKPLSGEFGSGRKQCAPSLYETKYCNLHELTGCDQSSTINNYFYDQEFPCIMCSKLKEKFTNFSTYIRERNIEPWDTISKETNIIQATKYNNMNWVNNLQLTYPGLLLLNNVPNSCVGRMSPIIQFVEPVAVKRKCIFKNQEMHVTHTSDLNYFNESECRKRKKYENDSNSQIVMLSLPTAFVDNIFGVLRDLANLLHITPPKTYTVLNSASALTSGQQKKNHATQSPFLNYNEMQNILGRRKKLCSNCYQPICFLGMRVYQKCSCPTSTVFKATQTPSFLYFCSRTCYNQSNRKHKPSCLNTSSDKIMKFKQIIKSINIAKNLNLDTISDEHEDPTLKLKRSFNKNQCLKYYNTNSFSHVSNFKRLTSQNVSDLINEMGITLLPKNVEEVSFVDTRQCVFCNQQGDGATDGPGRLLNFDINKWVHLNCALWSNEVYETLSGGLMNFQSALQVGLNQLCSSCQKLGATIKCFKNRCIYAYHLPCAIKEQCVFYKNKTILCQQHISRTEKENELTTLGVYRRVFIERDENRQVAAVMHFSELHNLLRIGTLTFLSIGQLLPHQLDAFHNADFIYPIGYKTVRFYWSMRRSNKRCRYICSIAEVNGRPEFRIQVQDITDDDIVDLKDSSPSAVWMKVLVKIVAMRKDMELVELFPKFISGEDFFGLTEPSIIRIIESLPGVENLTDYRFKYGRSLLFELPLAINPSGAARTEQKQRQVVSWRKPHTQRTSSAFSQRLANNTTSAVAGEVTCPYSKQFVHSKSSQYKKMKQEWRNNVYLARSKIQGLGLYAARDIEKHTMIIEYIGEVIRKEVSEVREKQYEARNRGIYMFRLDEERVVDATLSGGLARYINHACNPNCVTEIVDVDRELRIIIFAKRKINRGEELSYDYKFDIEDDAHKIPCMCSAPNCKKWMN